MRHGLTSSVASIPPANAGVPSTTSSGIRWPWSVLISTTVAWRQFAAQSTWHHRCPILSGIGAGPRRGKSCRRLRTQQLWQRLPAPRGCPVRADLPRLASCAGPDDHCSVTDNDDRMQSMRKAQREAAGTSWDPHFASRCCNFGRGRRAVGGPPRVVGRPRCASLVVPVFVGALGTAAMDRAGEESLTNMPSLRGQGLGKASLLRVWIMTQKTEQPPQAPRQRSVASCAA